MGSPSDVHTLATTFKKLGIDPEFADSVERTLAPRATGAGAWLELAASLRRRGAYEAALCTYDAAERRFPTVHQLPNNRGVLLRECGMLEEALAAFGEAVRLNPSYGNALESQGNVLELLGRFAEAEKIYRTLLALEPERATAWNNMGNCAHQLGRRAEARRCYERAIELDPDYVFALVNLAGLIDEQGGRARAITLLDRALQLDPQDEMATKLLRRILENKPKRSLEPPAWDAPVTVGTLLGAQSLRDYVERQQDDSRIVPALLKRSKALNDRAGFMAWDPKRLASDPVGDPGPHVVRLSPPTPAAPRLFLAYAWSQDDPSQLDGAYEQNMLMEAFAGHLFNTGYEIVYDRDPRNLDRGLNEIHVLRRMYDCNFFVPVVTERYLAKTVPTSPGRGMVGAEWDLACQLAAAGFLSFIGVWLSGDALPEPLTVGNTVDLRSLNIFDPALNVMFPPAAAGAHGVPRHPSPQRPPVPGENEFIPLPGE